MTPDQVTPQSLTRILFDPLLRGELFAALGAEQGRYPPLANRVDAAAQVCEATAAELDELVDILLTEDERDDVLYGLVFHRAMSEDTLMRLVDAGRALSALAHRAWPENLLLRLAREHRQESQEAVLTLALCTYAPAEVSEQKFLSFVREKAGEMDEVRVSQPFLSAEVRFLQTELRLQQAHKARLLEVVVRGEGVGDVERPHGVEGRAAATTSPPTPAASAPSAAWRDNRVTPGGQAKKMDGVRFLPPSD